LIDISVADYDGFMKQKGILEDISAFQNSIAKIKSEASEYKNYKIDYSPGKSLVIKEGENKKVYQLKGNNIETFNFTGECNIYGADYIMRINFIDIKDLINTDIKTNVEKTLQKMPLKKPFAGVRNFEINDTAITEHKELDRNSGKMDQLSIVIGIGAGVIKNQLLNDFCVTIGTTFARNGIPKYGFYLSLKDYFIFDAENKMKVDGCLSAGFKLNASKNINKQNWFGLEAGYFIKNSSKILGNDVIVVGTVKEFGRFSVTPQIYFSDGFNKYFPGLRLSFEW